MITAAIILYLIDILTGLSVLSIFLCVPLFIAFCLLAVAWVTGDLETLLSPERAAKAFKFIIIGLVLFGAFVSLIPSKSTMYGMAGLILLDSFSETEYAGEIKARADKMFELIDRELEKYLAEDELSGEK